uniref:NADH-ubiquinone oxidoreductase chain 6 n=1 Tax=Hydromanicus wulaianus TaxID=1435189 RepID=A0A342CFI6_9NEOP|nr:NADH dehydrogenase subunit 6 [Hydromanicus wulaianus]AHC32062.1 NADH dehydrogenase subunit 6 [Hydromanicus wulaianus]
MFKLILINFMIMISLILIFTKNPLNMGFMIIIQTLMFCLLMNFNIHIYWMSYIVYLVMLGGILILFMYMCSISSNEIIKFNFNILMFLSITFIINFIWMMNFHWIFKINLINNYTMNFFVNSNNMINISKIYNKFSMIITLMLVIYLLISMTMVTTFTNNYSGPLRSLK